ncbi:unnamed protein product [Rotaria sordida]|uniref:Uncharacterized protein n=1 Tax=Rotaria sordida TaxID=392033 RepID=A0A819R042_9BILA|nr:unnamed protein product [Rotaria sordida]
MATAHLGFSYASSKNIPELFTSMFPDSKIAADYAMKDRKLSYMISHGTGHYFVRELVKDVNKAPSYSLLFDETTIVGVRKQLDLHIRYWSESKQCVVTRYWKSIMLGHATADIISRHILDSLKCPSVLIGRDNPNVNKAVETMIDKELRSEREKKTGRAPANGLVSIGSCPLHVIHNAFKHGFTQNEWQVEDILYEFWFFFSRSSARREDYLSVVESIGDGVGRFMKRFVITRWIEVGPVIERVIDQWPILKEYFLVYLPKINKNIINNDRWKRIKNQLDQQQTLVHFQFVLYVYRHIFSKPLTWLQQSEPLVHMLFEECSDLFRNVLISFIKDDLIMNKTVKQLFSITLDSQANQKPDSKLEIGETTRNELKEMSTNDKATFFNDVRLIYLTIAQELKRTLPLNNEFLRHVRFIHPLLRQHESTRNSMMIVARELPHLLSDDELDQLSAEWRLYENETIPNECVKDAHSRYHADQEKMQRLLNEKEEAESAAKLLKDRELLLIEKEQKLIDERNVLQRELDNASKMLDEGNSRLEAAVATKNFGDIEVAQLLIGGANKKLDALKTQLNDNSEQMNQLRKKVKK